MAYARSKSWKVNLPGTCSVIRFDHVSSASADRAAAIGTPAMLAAAGTVMSGPGYMPNVRNICAAAALSC